MTKITFDKSASTFILDLFDKTIDKDGYIVEKSKPSQRVLAIDEQEIKLEEFAGVKKGSEVFLKSDLPSVIKLADRISSEDEHPQ